MTSARCTDETRVHPESNQQTAVRYAAAPSEALNAITRLCP
jgi:hypothetical protein